MNGWSQYGEHCYEVSHTSSNWINARETCLKSGADLASISSLAENDFIKSLSKESLWIGLNSLENELVYNWSDGTPSTFSFWFPREPNYLSQKCVKFYIGDGKWLDEYCSGRNFYVCKMKGWYNMQKDHMKVLNVDSSLFFLLLLLLLFFFFCFCQGKVFEPQQNIFKVFLLEGNEPFYLIRTVMIRNKTVNNRLISVI